MLSRVFLIKQGKCFGNGCLMCPYVNRHSGKSDYLRKGIMDNLEKWEKEELGLIKHKKEMNSNQTAK